MITLNKLFMRLVSKLKKKDLLGKRVLLRADLDVPIKDGIVANAFRLESVLPTINFLLKNGAEVEVVGHLGRRGESLAPIRTWLINKVKNPKLTVRENLRRDIGEEKNDKNFTKQLAKGFDLYVNDAFAASHRKHASVVGVAKLLPSYAGLQLEKEIKVLKSLSKPVKPLVLIIGGAKFESKLPVVEKFLPEAEKVFVLGALANLFLKRQGYEIGKSFVDSQAPSITKLLKSKKVFLPVDLVVKKINGAKTVVNVDGVKIGDTIVDAGPLTIKLLAESLKKAGTIVWNGPLGVCELGYKEGTEGLINILLKSKSKIIVGGGDTVAALNTNVLKKKNIFVSTGGGAMLQLLASGTLPGIKSLE